MLDGSDSGTPAPAWTLSSLNNDVPGSGTEHSHNHSFNEKDDSVVGIFGWGSDCTVTGLVEVIKYEVLLLLLVRNDGKISDEAEAGDVTVIIGGSVVILD